MVGVGVWQILRAHPAVIEICHRRAARREGAAIRTAGKYSNRSDLPGLVGTLWDGDLRGQTLVDCLPAGLVQQQNTATQQDDVPVHEPGSGSSTGRGCWHDLLKPHAKTNSERLTRKNVPFPTPLTLALVPVRGAFQQMTLAAVATGQAKLYYRRAVGLPARMPAGGCAGGAAWRAGRASRVARRGYAAPRRSLAPLGAPPRRLARARWLAAHRPDHGRSVGRAAWLAAGNGWNASAAPSAPSSRAPSPQ
jgi:hypothetical protein